MFGARRKIRCSSIGIILVLMGCGTTLCFEYGQGSPLKAKPRGLMDFFGNMFQQNSQEDFRSWPNMMPSVSQNLDCNHWGLYQKPAQQSDYERHFYNFGEQGNDVCSDEGMDYSSLDFSCQEADNNPCGEADSEYTDHAVDCNDDELGIRWKGSPPEEANIEIDEMILKVGQSQWSTGGGVSEDKFEDETTQKSIPNFSGLTNVDVHKCLPQGGNGAENGLQSKTSGDEYFVLVIKKDHILGDAMQLNKTTISIDAIIGASMQPPNHSDSAPADETLQSQDGSPTQGSSVDNATPIISSPTSSATEQPRINPTNVPVSSTMTPTSTTVGISDEAVVQLSDEPTKISILENPQISSSTTTGSVTSHGTEIPTSYSSATSSKSGSDEVASQSMDGPTKISLSTYQDSNIPVSDSVSKDLQQNTPTPTVIPSKYPNSPTSTAVPPNLATESTPTVPRTIWSTSVRPIVNHATVFSPTTVASADSQSEDRMDKNNAQPGVMNTPQNIPQSVALGSSFVGSNPEAIVNNTVYTPTSVTKGVPDKLNTQPTEMSRSPNGNNSGVPPVINSPEGTTPTLVNETSSSPTPTHVPAVYKTKPTEDDTAAVSTTKTDVKAKTAIIVNDTPNIVQPTNFGSTQLSDSASIVGETKSIDRNSAAVSTAESALQSEATIVNDVSPVTQTTSFGSTALGDLSKPVDNTVESELQPSTGATVNDTQDPVVEKPQTNISESSRLNGPTTVFTVKNDSQSVELGSESLHDQVVNRFSTEDPKSSDVHNHRLLTNPEKIPIHNNENVLDSQSTHTALTKNLPEKEIIAINKGTTHFETTSSDPTNSQTFTVPIYSNAGIAVRDSSPNTKQLQSRDSNITPTVSKSMIIVTTPAEDKSPPPASNFNPTLVGNDTRTNGSYADILAPIAGSQSESSTSNPNSGVSDVPNFESTTNPSLVTASTPQFEINEATPLTDNYILGVTSFDEISDVTVTTRAIPNIDSISDHNIKDIGHTIKGLQDLVNKLMSTVNSKATSSPSGTPEPAVTVTRPPSTEHPPESEISAIVNDSTETSKITVPTGDTIADNLLRDFDTNPIVSGSNPSVKGAVPQIETSTSSIELTTNSQLKKWNPHFDSKKDEEVSSTGAPISTGVTTMSIVLSSQSPMPTLKPLLGPTPTRSDGPPSVKNDSPTMAGVINPETTELPGKTDSTVNETRLPSKDPPTADEIGLINVTPLQVKEPDNLGSSIPHSIDKPVIVNDSRASDNGGSISGNSPEKDLNSNGSPLENEVRDELATTTPGYSSQLPDITVHQTNGSDSGSSLYPVVNDLSDKIPSTNGVTEEIPTASGKVSSPSPELMTPLTTPAPPGMDSNGTAVNITDANNHQDFTNSSQSPEFIPVINSSNTSSSSPTEPVAEKDPVESNPVTFTENSYDASSFTSTNAPVPTEETSKSPSRPKGIHKILSFMSWMRGKKSAGNATENAATQLTESAFDPIEEIIETSDNGRPVIDKDILPENLANWFLGFHSAEEEDTSHMSDVNESQSAEVPDANVEFNDLYHSFLESAIHNINNASSIVNASEPIGTPFSWWSRFREVEDDYNNTLMKSLSTDAAEAGSQSSSTIDDGFVEGAIHKVNDAAPIVNGSDSTWRRWMSKLRGYKNMLKSSLTLNGPSSGTNQSSIVGTIHNNDDASSMAEKMEQSKGESSWFSKFWKTKSGHDNSTSIMNATDVMEIERDRLSRSFTGESSVGSTNGTSIGSNVTTGDLSISQSLEFYQNSTESLAKTNSTEVDDESSTVKIIFTKPKAEWLSLLAGIQAAQEGSLPTVNETQQQSDVRLEGKANDTSAKPSMYSHFHGSDFEVWSGENV